MIEDTGIQLFTDWISADEAAAQLGYDTSGPVSRACNHGVILRCRRKGRNPGPGISASWQVDADSVPRGPAIREFRQAVRELKTWKPAPAPEPETTPIRPAQDTELNPLGMGQPMFDNEDDQWPTSVILCLSRIEAKVERCLRLLGEGVAR